MTTPHHVISANQTTPRETKTAGPLVSGVIPTLNSGSTIRQCLESVRSQPYPAIETIVVDGGSQDTTTLVVAELNAELVFGPFKRTTARRVGAIKARGAYLVSALEDTGLGLLIFLAFIAFGVASWYFRISYRASVVAGLSLLVAAALAAAAGGEEVGNFIALLAYYSLVVGVSLAIIEYTREERAKRRIFRAEEATAIVPGPRAHPLRAKLSDYSRRLSRRQR